MGRKPPLLFLALLSAIAGIALAVTPSSPLLLVLAFVGVLNGMGTDRSAAFAREQAIIPGLVPDSSRTWTLAWYNVVLDTGGAIGALAAGLPLLLARWSSFRFREHEPSTSSLSTIEAAAASYKLRLRSNDERG